MSKAKLELLDDFSFQAIEEVPIRDGFGHGLLELGKKNRRVVALSADLTESTRVQKFAEAFPERFYQVGVAEQNLVGIAAGMAHSGLIPFAASYAVFSPGRSWDQLRVSVCYARANVKIVGSHAGLSVGADGASHQGLEDIAITRVLPNMTVVVPCDAIEAGKATLAIGALVGPAYLRLGREKVPTITNDKSPFVLGKALTLVRGHDLTIIANGPLVFPALQAARQLLEDGIKARVLNLHTVKPLDGEALLDAATETGAIVTAEDHQVAGGLGSAVAEYLADRRPVPLVRVGVTDKFGESGSVKELMEHYGFSQEGIVRAATKVLELKNAS
jgi:transketolase